MDAMRLNAGLLVSLLTLPAMPAVAADDGYRYELTPFVSQRFGGTFEDRDTGDDFELDDSSAYGFIFGFPWDYNTQFEVYYSHQDTDLDDAGFISSGNPVGVELDTLQIGGTYFFEPRGDTVPFFSATLGGTKIKPDAPGTKSDTVLSFGVGGGWKFFNSERIGVRLEGRFNGILIDSNSDIFCASGPGGSGCLINTKGEILWQFEAQAGVIFRF